jgi:hypothetical protein
VRVIAEPFSYWIPPNVAGDVLDDLVGPQNVIVVTHLPKAPAMSLFEFIRRALFEGVDELNQVRSVRESLTKEMNVVRHDAIGVKREIPLSGSFQEMTEQPSPSGLILEKGRAHFGPNGHEINPGTAVVFRRAAKTFLKKRHADKANTQWMLQRKSWAKAQPLQRHARRAGLGR